VKINVSEIEFRYIPQLKRVINPPVSIGFRIKAYGSFVTILGGGLNGTGVPLILKKVIADHKTINIPIISIGIATTLFIEEGRSAGILNNLSNASEANTNKRTMVENNTKPTGV
jgi:hypothetical protein